MSFSRRCFIKSIAVTAGAMALPSGIALAQPSPVNLRAGLLNQALLPDGPDTNFWGFNDTVPGPVLRYRKGDRVRLLVENALPADTAVHWHGVRVPNDMDGVPHVTQAPIEPGGEFAYEFDLPDSGTFWYHPHQMSFEQVPRGLYGAFIVEEEQPIEVDRDITWVLSDVKIDASGRQVEDFGRILDFANEGRLGNRILVNGKAAGAQEVLEVRSGERIRLRLINAASARTFELAVPDHVMNAIAYDGQAVQPHVLENVQLGPGMRTDLVIDCMQAPRSRHLVNDAHRRNLGPIATLSYSDEAPLRSKALGAPMQLAPNEIPEPDLSIAKNHYIMFQGGMRGEPVIGNVDGKPLRTHQIMEEHGLAWTMNYSAQHEHALMHVPLLHLGVGEHVLLRMINDTDYAHPMHLHGHFFRVVAIDGQRTPHQEWRDTVMMAPRQTIDIAFVADNAGEWMYHCHILDHAAGGMMGTFKVG